MRQGRFSEDRIIGILKHHHAGIPLAELCPKHWIIDAIDCTWRTKYGGTAMSDARKLKALEHENRNLKRLRAESILDVATLREALGNTLRRRAPGAKS